MPGLSTILSVVKRFTRRSRKEKDSSQLIFSAWLGELMRFFLAKEKSSPVEELLNSERMG